MSCSPEKNLARKFISSPDTVKILLLKTDYVFKKNLKDRTDSLPVENNDSVRLAKFEVIGKVNDKTVVNLIYSGMIDELRKRKTRVYTEENMNSFMALNSNAYIFNLAQIELDESYTLYTASEKFDTTLYSQEFNLNTAGINLWYEFSMLNSDDDSNKILYSTINVSDMIEGYFRKSFLSNQVKYYYTRKNITINDVYDMAMNFGENNAGYIYDYFLNQYIFTNYKGRKKIKYMHYDFQNNRISPAGFNRFIFM